MTGNVWIHRWSQPLKWWQTILTLLAVAVAVIVLVIVPLLALAWFVIHLMGTN